MLPIHICSEIFNVALYSLRCNKQVYGVSPYHPCLLKQVFQFLVVLTSEDKRNKHFHHIYILHDYSTARTRQFFYADFEYCLLFFKKNITAQFLFLHDHIYLFLDGHKVNAKMEQKWQINLTFFLPNTFCVNLTVQ